MIFLNLPVQDLAASTRFYEAIGCVKNAQFSDDNAASMAWSDAIIFQLMSRDYFETYATRPLADARASNAMLIALSRDSREEVDAMVEAAAAHGGTADVRPPQDMGFLYVRTFEDPDGHVFEPAWMDMAAFTEAAEAQAG
jgi:hypothetical protein